MILHPWRLLLFLLLSLSDLGLTWLLVEGGGGHVYESNPVAGWWLDSYGWAGLAVFKVLMVVGVVGLSSAVSHYRPRSGGLILTVACSALALVVGYSVYLAGGGAPASAPDAGESAEIARLQAESDRIDAAWQVGEDYRAVLEQVCADLQDGRCSLTEATARLGATAKGGDPEWRQRLHLYFPAGSDEGCLAASIVLQTLRPLHADPGRAERLARRLVRELNESYGDLPDWDYRTFLAMAGIPAAAPESTAA